MGRCLGSFCFVRFEARVLSEDWSSDCSFVRALSRAPLALMPQPPGVRGLQRLPPPPFPQTFPLPSQHTDHWRHVSWAVCLFAARWFPLPPAPPGPSPPTTLPFLYAVVQQPDGCLGVPPPPPRRRLHSATGSPPRNALERKGPKRLPQKRLDRRLEEFAEAVGGGYCRLQMPLKLTLGRTWRVRGTAAGHRLGALEGRGRVPPPTSNAPTFIPRCVLCWPAGPRPHRRAWPWPHGTAPGNIAAHRGRAAGRARATPRACAGDPPRLRFRRRVPRPQCEARRADQDLHRRHGTDLNDRHLPRHPLALSPQALGPEGVGRGPAVVTGCGTGGGRGQRGGRALRRKGARG